MRADAVTAGSVAGAPAPLFARVSTDVSITVMNYPTDITGLSVALVAGTYALRAVLHVKAQTTIDLQANLSVPAGTKSLLSGLGLPYNVGASVTEAANLTNGFEGVGSTTAGYVVTGTNNDWTPFTIDALLIATTAGNAQLQLSYLTASGAAYVRAQSYMVCQKVA